MQAIAILVFWVALGILFYCYAGYGLLVWLLTKLRKLFRRPPAIETGEFTPPVTLVVTAYNEGGILDQKIRNSLEIDYPRGQLQLFFVTDGSTDGSEKIVQQFPVVRSLYMPGRKGKYAAIKRAMKEVATPIVVFSDANTMLNRDCVRKMAAHYAKENVGGVAGEKKIQQQNGATAVGAAEGLYWQYESFLKKMDADLNTVTGAAGELFSIRSSLFRELDDSLILDDFIISMQLCLDGYKIAYEPGAYALEMPSASLQEEAKRKVRISAGAYQSIRYLKACLNFWKRPLLAFQFLSRRVIRWVFCPPLLIVLFASNAYLALLPETGMFYRLFFYAQGAFYACAMIGWRMALAGKKAWLFTVPFYFVFMNYCLVKGFFRYISGRQSVLWEKSKRQVALP